MFSNSGSYVSSEALLNLQSELNALSRNLEELYETLSDAISLVNEDWCDSKFEEFEQEFRSSKELILELSEKYDEWANGYLPPRIETIMEAEKLRMGIK